jgi:hypothetical protein
MTLTDLRPSGRSPRRRASTAPNSRTGFVERYIKLYDAEATELTAAGARELAAALVECGRCLRRRSVTRARRLALLRLVDGRRFLVALSEAATRVAPAPPVPQGVRRRHPLSCLPHHRQDTLVELLGEHLDAINVSRAGKTLGRTIVLPANPGQLLTAPDSWTVSSVARHGRNARHCMPLSCDLRVDVRFFGRYSSGSRYR